MSGASGSQGIQGCAIDDRLWQAVRIFHRQLAGRSQDTLATHAALLRDAFRGVLVRHPFDIVAMVALPDHLYAIWLLPPNDSDYPLRWSLIKPRFLRLLPKVEPVREARRNKRERGVWQRRYWQHRIRDDRDLQTHVDYIHYNPVKHGYIFNPVDWPHSSIHRYIASGALPPGWASGVSDRGDFGE